MVTTEVTPRERQDKLLEYIKLRGTLTTTEAWYIGEALGYYAPGDTRIVQADLAALCQRNQARKHDGFWRHAHEPDSIRKKHIRWGDYWTPR